MNNKVNSSFLRVFIRVIFIIIRVLLIFNFARKLSFNTDLSFSAFLNLLGTVESFDINVNISSFAINGDWGIFDDFRSFLNIFANLFGVIVYLGANLVNLFVFIGQFLTFMFV